MHRIMSPLTTAYGRLVLNPVMLREARVKIQPVSICFVFVFCFFTFVVVFELPGHDID